MGVVGFLTIPAFAQNAPATTPVRVAGTVEQLDGNNLSVKTKDGQAVTVTLNADAAIDSPGGEVFRPRPNVDSALICLASARLIR